MPNTYLLQKITARNFFENMTKKLEISNVSGTRSVTKLMEKSSVKGASEFGLRPLTQ